MKIATIYGSGGGEFTAKWVHTDASGTENPINFVNANSTCAFYLHLYG